jgi:Tol biopolymer transport system component
MIRAWIHRAAMSTTAVLVIASCSGEAAGGPSGSFSTTAPVTAPVETPAMSASPSAVTSPLAVSSPGSIALGEPWIAYVGSINDDHVGIRLVRPDGSDDRIALPDIPLPPKGWQNFPDWSPDGRRIAFSADDGSDDTDQWTRDLWIADMDRPGAVKALDCVLPCQEYAWPAWSPDGRRIAFTTFELVGGVADGSSLMALDVETGATTTIARTNGPEYMLQPRWSPDGRSLVVGIDRFSDTSTTSTYTGSAIALVDLGSGSPAPRRLTDWDLWANYADWHPSKDLIVFSTRPWTALEEGPSNLLTMRPDGSAPTLLTHFTAPGDRAVQPSWTPDGKSIIFTKVVGTGFGEATMATVDAAGTDLRSATGDTLQFGTHARLRPTQ